MALVPSPPPRPSPQDAADLLFFAATPQGIQQLSVPPGARTAHDCFDGLPLGVYSALRTFDQDRFLRLEQHFDRTDRSLELLHSRERLDRPRLSAALHEALALFGARGPRDAFVRFDYLAAPAPDLGATERLLLALSPLHPVPPDFLRAGVGVGLSPLRRDQPLVKKARFVIERRPHPTGTRASFENLLLDQDERLLEGTSSNFLAVHDGRLHRTGDGALQGITQRFVAELAQAEGLEVVEKALRLADVPRLEEAFLTGSSRGIVPIATIAGRPVGSGRPGPWTQRLLALYVEHAPRAARPPLESART